MRAPGRSAGFTLIEVVITMVILAILAAVGVPQMAAMTSGANLGSMVEFYMEGLRRARAGAVQYNGASRLVLTVNGITGQYNWETDWCLPTATVACSDVSGTWTTTASTTPAPSISRPARGLPTTAQYTVTVVPANANAIYFNSLGWLNNNVAAQVSQLTIASADGSTRTAIKILRSGLAVHCNPDVAAPDSRACP